MWGTFSNEISTDICKLLHFIGLQQELLNTIHALIYISLTLQNGQKIQILNIYCCYSFSRLLQHLKPDRHIFAATYIQVLCAILTSKMILNMLLTMALLFIEKPPVIFFFSHWQQKVMPSVIASFVPGRYVCMASFIDDASLKVPK